MKTMASTLVIDTREGKILSHTNELNQIRWETKQMTTGDYALYNNDNLLAIFERKTLADYGASIKDGRANNKDKMLAMRAKTGCRVFYIIEGNKSPSPDTKFARIPYRCIQASIDHLMMRDGIIVMQTLNTLDTAKRLVDFVKNTDTLLAKIGDSSFLRCNDAADGDADGTDTAADGGGDSTFSVGDLTAIIKKSDQDVVREMWACFKGITVETADSFIDKWTIADIVQKKVPRADLEAHKMPNRRLLSRNIVNALLTIGPTIETKLLTKIPQVSAKTANDLLRNRTLAAIVSAPVEVISIYTFGKLNMKIGNVRAQNIIKLFHYSAGIAGEGTVDAGHVLGAAEDAAVDAAVDAVAANVASAAADVPELATNDLEEYEEEVPIAKPIRAARAPRAPRAQKGRAAK